MAKQVLPKVPAGWRIERLVCVDPGTGYGDDRYSTALYHWVQLRERRRPFRKARIAWGWQLARFAAIGMTDKELAAYAWATDSAERGAISHG